MIQLEVSADPACSYPPKEKLKSWITAALAPHRPKADVSLRIVGEAEMAQLNQAYRGKDYATNILSFPCQLPEKLRKNALGDLVICAPVLEKEAQAQGKTLENHWAHLVIHGTLHLLGFDHVEAGQAKDMEDQEKNILRIFGIDDPYTLETLHD